MFAYNPGVYDQSGQILADSVARTAAVQAQMYNDLGKNIGGGLKKAASAAVGFATGGPAGAAMAVQNANQENGGGFLDTIVNSYAKREQDKSDAKIYGNLMKIIAPAFGKEGDGILQTFNELESDAERAEFGRTIAGSLGVIGNMYAQTNRLGLQQSMPGFNATLRNQRDLASGQGTFTPDAADTADTEPPLPPFSPGGGATPSATPTGISPDSINKAKGWGQQRYGK